MSHLDIYIYHNISWDPTLDFPRISHAISARSRRAVIKLFPADSICLSINMALASNDKTSITVYKDSCNTDSRAIGQQVLDHLMSVMTIAAKDRPHTPVTRCLAAICLQYLHEELVAKLHGQSAIQLEVEDGK